MNGKSLARLLVSITAVLGACCFVSGGALAQAWPSASVRMVVNFPPGSAVDQVARVVEPALRDALGRPMIIENRSGAGGLIGAKEVANSPADGYTILFSPGSTVALVPLLYANPLVDPLKDLQAVAATAKLSLYLVVRPGLAVQSVADLIAHVKAHPGEMNFGSAGNGTTMHVAGEMMKRQWGLNVTHVAYKGTPPAVTDLLGGRIDFMFDPGVALPHVRAGRIRLLAVGGVKRVAAFPDVPTMIESGALGFDTDNLLGVFVPIGTPREIVSRLHLEIVRAMQIPKSGSQMAALGGEPLYISTEEFAAQLRSVRESLGSVIREAGIRAE
jgi:tripartite-type tricarboxylate transporter receptor subunit TctC